MCAGSPSVPLADEPYVATSKVSFFLRERGRCHRAGRADRAAEILPLKVSRDSLECAEEKGLVPHHGPAERAAELLAVEVVERRAVGQLAGQRLETLEMEHGSVRLVGPRL